MSWTNGAISGGVVTHSDTGNIHITGNIDSGAVVTLATTGGTIIIDGKIDGGSTVNLTASGDIQIGAAGGNRDNLKIDGGSTVTVMSGGAVSLGGKIDHNSNVSMVANGGSITIGGKIDHNSVVEFTASGDVLIGADSTLGGGDRKIDGNSNVAVQAGIRIHLFNKIDGGSISGAHSTVDFKACGGIAIDDKIDGGSVVRLAVNSGTITIGDKIGGGGTNVTFWPPTSLLVTNGIDSHAIVTPLNWVGAFSWCSPSGTTGGAGQQGYYWQNWPMTFGYVTPNRVYPRTVADVVAAVKQAALNDLPVKAIGGGWSFSDASLPMTNQADVDAVSILKRGANGTQDFHNILQGLNNGTVLPADFQPEVVDSDLAGSQTYDQTTLEEVTASGANLPLASETMLIDTRGLASSLQGQLHSILSDPARRSTKHYFHVEAGITMEDLDQLLDHQNPRLALQASGGSVGATLAGTLASATHGAEFQWPLLIDCVRAIHLVAPDGKEWWIEGDVPIADFTRLRRTYPNISRNRFVSGSRHLSGLSAQDILNAVIVSMGTMGVVYSVVLEVVPQFGLQQICVAIPSLPFFVNSWEFLLLRAGTNVAEIRSGSTAANIKVLNFLLDGAANGTGIAYNSHSTENVFCDLAINPLNQDCWITNRRVTPSIPIDGNSPATDWLGALNQTLGGRAQGDVMGSMTMGRIFDFLNWAKDVANPFDDLNDIQQAGRLGTFLTSFPDILVAAAATLSAQAVANGANEPNNPDRGQQFLADALSGFLHAVQGTVNGATGDTTAVSYKIWGFGWPANGFPGRGLEIALPRETAFTFLQTVLFDQVLTNTIQAGNMPLIGYISVRVCPQTNTLMGMQQFSPYSIMIEVVGYRSPEANFVMNQIQQLALQAQNVMLHWGLENDQVTAANLAMMPVSNPLSGTSETRLSAFQKVRQLLSGGNTNFENNFVNRLNL